MTWFLPNSQFHNWGEKLAELVKVASRWNQAGTRDGVINGIELTTTMPAGVNEMWIADGRLFLAPHFTLRFNIQYSQATLEARPLAFSLALFDRFQTRESWEAILADEAKSIYTWEYRSSEFYPLLEGRPLHVHLGSTGRSMYYQGEKFTLPVAFDAFFAVINDAREAVRHVSKPHLLRAEFQFDRSLSEEEVVTGH